MTDPPPRGVGKLSPADRQRFVQVAMPTFAALGEHLQASVLPAFGQWDVIAAEIGRSVSQQGAAFLAAFDAVAESWNTSDWPPNWDDDIDDWPGAVCVVRDEHIPLAWTPPNDLVVELVSQPTPERRQRLLVQRRRDISTHCADLADELTATQFGDVGPALREAAMELRVGRYRGAQALAAATLSGIASDVYGHAHLSDARKGFDKGDPMRVVLEEIRTVLAFLPAAMALRNQTEPRSGFNRHLTSHAVTADQYTPPHAVVSVMVAASLAREAQEQFDEGSLISET